MRCVQTILFVGQHRGTDMLPNHLSDLWRQYTRETWIAASQGGADLREAMLVNSNEPVLDGSIVMHTRLYFQHSACCKKRVVNVGLYTSMPGFSIATPHRGWIGFGVTRRTCYIDILRRYRQQPDEMRPISPQPLCRIQIGPYLIKPSYSA